MSLWGCRHDRGGGQRSKDRRRHPMGESQQEQLSMGFDARVRLEFVGSRITSDAGLLAYRELDEQLGLTEMADRFLAEQRTGRNVQH